MALLHTISASAARVGQRLAQRQLPAEVLSSLSSCVFCGSQREKPGRSSRKRLFSTAKEMKMRSSSPERTSLTALDVKQMNAQERTDQTVLDMKQINIPDLEEEFKGLVTDFPCLTRNKTSGPEPEYDKIVSGFKTFHHPEPFKVRYNGGLLPQLDLAYETWGELNENKDNAVLIFTGLSGSSHAKSHRDNTNPGWWEKFIGPGCALDTDKFFIICTNNLGGCYGSTGPSSLNPLTEEPYATTFPILSVEDMCSAHFLLLDSLGIDRLYASVGSSLGGMLSLLSAVIKPERIGRLVSISACVKSHPNSIAMRYLQRKAIMTDPNWLRGYYYNSHFYPRMGMKLAREIATLTYRSGPEWEERFGRQRIHNNADPSLCPYFMIENYLDYQGEAFCTRLDPNTLLYISKAMDLFDLGEMYGSVKEALSRVKCPVLIMGAQSDILFPIWQQREIVDSLHQAGHEGVTFYELNSVFGHDTFLLDLSCVGAGVKGFLETNLRERGRVKKDKNAGVVPGTLD